MDEKTSDPVVIFMPEGSKTHMGGTMRLGSRRSLFLQQCQASRLYESLGAGKTDESGVLVANERHRHRYEVNPDYVLALEAAGLSFVARDETGKRMEILELPEHRYFVGCQFHPEFKSRPLHPSPLFVGLLQAAIANQQ
jgi:CTP synthase